MTFYSRKRGIVSIFDSVNRVYCTTEFKYQSHHVLRNNVSRCLPMATRYLKNNHITYYVITQVGVYVEQWYVITSNVTWIPGHTIKLLEAGCTNNLCPIQISIYLSSALLLPKSCYLSDICVATSEPMCSACTQIYGPQKLVKPQ